jgi:hypothetical protein
MRYTTFYDIGITKERETFYIFIKFENPIGKLSIR